MNQLTLHGGTRLKIGKTQSDYGHSWTVLEIEHSVHGPANDGHYTETSVTMQVVIHHRNNQVLLIDREGS